MEVEMATRPSFRAGARRLLAVPILAWSLLSVSPEGSPRPAFSAEDAGPMTNRMVCGECPEGYAITGVTSAPTICKEGDPTLVQCVPLGSKLLAVCGDCPEGYSTIGTSLVPSRCGSEDSGRMTQCQLEEGGSSFLDPSREGERVLPTVSRKRVKPAIGTNPGSTGLVN